MTLLLNVQPDAAGVAQAAADRIAEQVRANPQLTMLTATGRTPMATYAELARRVRAGELDLSRITAVQLDEYWDLTQGTLPETDPRSLWGWTRRAIIEPLGITRAVRLGPSVDAEGACAAYDAAVQALGGIDLAILGLGPNGHLGFNEPPSPASAVTRLTELTDESVASNRAYWDRDVPTHALTAGMSTVLAARTTLLLVTGAHKRGILERVLHGPQTPEVPASLLGRPGVTIIADQSALSEADDSDHDAGPPDPANPSGPAGAP